MKKQKRSPSFKQAHVFEEVEFTNNGKAVEIFYDFDNVDRPIEIYPGETKTYHTLRQISKNFHIERSHTHEEEI